jgi:hypothetical protein
MIDFELDLDGAEMTRTAMVDCLRASGAVDEDILAALSQPGVPDWLLSHPFQVVADLDDLKQSGAPAEVSEEWREGLPARIEEGSREQLIMLYQRVLTAGTHEKQRALLHREYLVQIWPDLAREVHPAIVSVWEQRFPGLRR